MMPTSIARYTALSCYRIFLFGSCSLDEQSKNRGLGPFPTELVFPLSILPSYDLTSPMHTTTHLVVFVLKYSLEPH